MSEPEVFEIVRDTLKLQLIRLADMPELKMWDLFGPHNPHRCGQLVMTLGDAFPGTNVRPWAIINIWVWFDLRGKGIMRELLPRLLQYYDPICSCLKGNNSPHAIRMWQALKASMKINPYPGSGLDMLYILWK